MTAALEGGEWSAARHCRTLPPGKTRYPFYRRLGGPQGRSGRAENLFPTGIRLPTIQPIVSRSFYINTRRFTNNNSIEQGLPLECNKSTASKEMPRILWNLQFRYDVHGNQPSIYVLSNMIPVCKSSSYFLQDQFLYHPRTQAYVFQVVSLSSCYPTKPCLLTFLSSHAYRIPCPSHSP